MSNGEGDDKQDEEEDEVYGELSEDETTLSLKEALSEARAQCGTLTSTQQALIADLKELIARLLVLLPRKNEPGVMEELRELLKRRDQHIQWCEDMQKRIVTVNKDLEAASEAYAQARVTSAERKLGEARADLATARMQAEADATRMRSDINVPD